MNSNCRSNKHNQAQGFTLVELLVALFVFSLISGFAYTSINTMVKAGDAIEAEMTALASLQKAMQSLERDLRQKVVPIVATAEKSAADLNTNLNSDKTQLELRLISSSLGTQSQTNKLIRYRLKDKTLVREVWKNNKLSTEPPDEWGVLVKQVTRIEFASLDLTATPTNNEWPAYFQLTLEHENLGLIKRVVYLGVKQPELNFSSLSEDPAQNGGTGGGGAPLGKPCPGSTNPNC